MSRPKPKAQNQLPVKVAGARAVRATDVVALGVPLEPLKFNPYRNNSRKYIPFTGISGKENLYPQEIAKIARGSATLNSILVSKTELCAGDEIIVEPAATATLFENINADNQSFWRVFLDTARQFYTHGHAWVQIVKSGAATNLYNIDTEKVRYGALEKDSLTARVAIIHHDWEKFKSDASKAEVIDLWPVFTEMEDGRAVSMMHIRNTEPGVDYYSVPDWIGAMSDAKTEYLIGVFNQCKMDNGMFSSGILEILDSSISDEEAELLVREYKKKLFGTENGNAGKVLIIVGDAGQQLVRWTPLTKKLEGDWDNMDKRIVQKLITATRWLPSLAGIPTPAGIGGDESILNDWEIGLTRIKPSRNLLISAFMQVFKECGIPAEIEFINKPPKSDRVYDAPQISAMTDIVVKFATQELSEAQAMGILTLSYNLSKEDAGAALGLN